MTPAERVKKHRQAQQAKLADKERRNLVAQLAKILKRMLPFADPKSPLAHKVFAERRMRLRKIHDEWVLLPIDEVRKALKLYKDEKDSYGRLHGESSGEGDRKNGMSGVEQRIAKAEGQRHGDHDDDPVPVRGGELTTYNTEREPSTRSPRGMRIPKEHIDYLDGREEIITELIEQHVRKISLDDDQPAHRCLLCSAKLPEFSDARQHFWEEYDKGLRLFYRHQELTEDSKIAELAEFIIDDIRKAYQNHKHLQEVWRVSRDRAKHNLLPSGRGN